MAAFVANKVQAYIPAGSLMQQVSIAGVVPGNTCRAMVGWLQYRRSPGWKRPTVGRVRFERKITPNALCQTAEILQEGETFPSKINALRCRGSTQQHVEPAHEDESG